MLNWFKKKARITINSRYAHILRRNFVADMLVSEQSLLNQQMKVVIINCKGEEYPLDVNGLDTVKSLKGKAIQHFSQPLETETSNYNLVLAREKRMLLDDAQIHDEHILDNDDLLLVECRLPDDSSAEKLGGATESTPTQDEICMATKKLHKQNFTRKQSPRSHAMDFKVEFRRIILTIIEVSVKLISATPEAVEVFARVLERLEMRHHPRVDTGCLKQLVEMGFPEARAIKALQKKRHLTEAMDLLLEEGALEDGNSDDSSIQYFLSKNNFQDTEDVGERVLKTFKEFRKRWFRPESSALESLIASQSCSRQEAIDALRVNGNDKRAAEKWLQDGKKPTVDDLDRGMERNSPMIIAILASPVIQLALPKAKTLVALMAICENPNSTNVWLSDHETFPVISHILRIYHAEKHSNLEDSATTYESSVSSPQSFTFNVPQSSLNACMGVQPSTEPGQLEDGRLGHSFVGAQSSSGQVGYAQSLNLNSVSNLRNQAVVNPVNNNQNFEPMHHCDLTSPSLMQVDSEFPQADIQQMSAESPPGDEEMSDDSQDYNSVMKL